MRKNTESLDEYVGCLAQEIVDAFILKGENFDGYFSISINPLIISTTSNKMSSGISSINV
ncbi:hypothetical protein AGMMS50293_24640 [Spirochaetia bacterium]|nr:hypothetical protein AGMMS50293_24640 [Spirochaetia bacterium]